MNYELSLFIKTFGYVVTFLVCTWHLVSKLRIKERVCLQKEILDELKKLNADK